MNYSPSTVSRIADINLGIRVDKDSMVITGISTKPIFTVVGGRVLVRALIAQCADVAIQAQANATTFVSTPTVGAVADMCAAADINNMAIGGMLSLPGITIATVAHMTTTTAVGAVPACDATGIIVPAGVIGLKTAASNSGQMKFSLFYIPLDDGAYVTAV